MKKLILSLSLIILFYQTILSQGGWYWQSPYPQPNELHDVCFPDSLNGWAVGNQGTIIYTLDGGNSWDQQFFGTDPLYGVWFINSNSGWIVGHNGLIMHT